MKKLSTVLSGVCIATLFLYTAIIVKAEEKKEEPVSAIVNKVDSKDMTLEVHTKAATQPLVFSLTAETKIYQAGKQISIDDITAGKWVRILPEQMGEKMVAKEIAVFDKEPPLAP